MYKKRLKYFLWGTYYVIEQIFASILLRRICAEVPNEIRCQFYVKFDFVKLHNKFVTSTVNYLIQVRK